MVVQAPLTCFIHAFWNTKRIRGSKSRCSLDPICSAVPFRPRSHRRRHVRHEGDAYARPTQRRRHERSHGRLLLRPYTRTSTNFAGVIVHGSADQPSTTSAADRRIHDQDADPNILNRIDPGDDSIRAGEQARKAVALCVQSTEDMHGDNAASGTCMSWAPCRTSRAKAKDRGRRDLTEVDKLKRARADHYTWAEALV